MKGKTTTAGGLPLYFHAAVPEYLRRDHIHTHYRAFYSLAMCARSLFSVHNDTGNVWTHLIGGIFFIFAAIWTFRSAELDLLPHGMTFGAFFVGALMCMGFSASFHLFCPHTNPRVYQRMLLLDYMGISTLVTGSFLPPALMMFAKEPTMCAIYTTVILMLASVGFIGPFFPKFLTKRYTPLRVGVYVLLVILEAVPLLHAMLLSLHRYHPYLHVIAASVAVYGLGVVVYVTRMPECFWPGRFDVWFHSHQIWHVCCVLAAAMHLAACYAMYQTHVTLF